MKRLPELLVVVFASLALFSPVAYGQDDFNAPDEYPAAPPPAQAYTQQQIDQLAAPIALYPDPLVGQILMASTYPSEVVEADRWLQSDGDNQLQGDQLAAALAAQPWDPSVKSLVAFPQVLSMMDSNLQWTEQLGDAFLANQAAVSSSVQRLREMAQTAGNLSSTPQQSVSIENGAILIEPANPDMVYVPSYNPTAVYGAWPYAGYPPYYFPPPPGYEGTDVGLLWFGAGIVVVDSLWGWDRWDWTHNRIDIDDRRFESLNGGRSPSFSGGVWAYDPSHRHGVPYQSPAARSQFQNTAGQTSRNYRGYDGTNASGRPAATRSTTSSVQERPAARPAEAAATYAPPRQQAAARPQFRARPQVQPQQQAAPVFESFSRGEDVRAQSQRGATSRASAPAARPQPQVQRQSAPSGGGNNNRDNGRNR